MDESHDEGILIGGDEIDPLRVDRTGTADDGVYVGSTIVIATMKPLEQVPRTSPWSRELRTISKLQVWLEIKGKKFSFHNELNAIPSQDLLYILHLLYMFQKFFGQVQLGTVRFG